MRAESQEDADLVRELATGDEAALEALYGRYGAACYRLAHRILADAHLAEDIVQQVFLALWQGSGYDPSRGALSTWLLGVTHHKAVDMVRREERRKAERLDAQSAELPSAGPGPEELAWEGLRAERTREALRQLSAEHREVLLLAYYGGYTQSEIADLTGLPLGTVKSRTLHAMRGLRTRLGSTLDTDEGAQR
ncbi:MAG TPA: sigma-70 family RNA polymerase sigma factor [Mycobacteriales bacterium]|jgi:RNA polymerase sigma-70 factor (ECF subfamily)|nr:sigma-70 family RNA polymerase sigma factor [Mycobacteriales bacterium]